MGDSWILSNLEAAISFINALFEKLYDILAVNPVTYMNGEVWKVVNTIYDALLGSAISLMIIFIYLGLIEDTGDMIKHKNPGPVIWAFVKIMFGSGILIYGRYIMMLIFWIFKEFTDKIVLRNGVNVFLVTSWISGVPDNIKNTVNGLSVSNGIIFWVVTLLAALVIMVTCFTIMLVVYGRIFKIYMHIALSPLPLACMASRTTQPHFAAFLKSFIAVLLEGLIIIIACLIFSAFANGFNTDKEINPLKYISSDEYHKLVDEIQNDSTLTDEEKETKINSLVSDAFGTATAGLGSIDDAAERLWIYLGQMLFLYVLFAGIVKSADDYVKRWMGV